MVMLESVDIGHCRLNKTCLYLLILSVVTCVVTTQAHEGHKGHSCAHSTHIEPILREKAERHQHPEKFFPVDDRESAINVEKRKLQNAVQPFSFHTEYQLSGLDADLQAFLKEQVIPSTVAYLSSILSNKQGTPEKLLLPRFCNQFWGVEPPLCYSVSDVGTCLSASHNISYFGQYKTCSTYQEDSCIQHEAGPGVENKDIILYVTAVNTESCTGETLAVAGWCELDALTKRPVAGNINFCPSRLDVNKLEGFLDTAVHEVLHVLAFSESLYGYFLGEDGVSLGISNAIKTTGDRKSIITPKAVEAGKVHYGCSSLTEIPLENEGGSATAGSHWEELHLEGDIMMGTQHRTRSVMSNITLALLEDSGWYNVDRNYQGFLKHGHLEGCTFVSDSCPSLLQDFPQYYCLSESSGTQCNIGYTSYGPCSSSSFGDTCITRDTYNNGFCQDTTLVTDDTLRFGEMHGSNSRCIPVPNDLITVTEGNLIYSKNGMGGVGCFQSFCEANKLYVSISGQTKECTHGSYLNLQDFDEKFTSGRIGPCPKSEDVCPYSGCANDCNGKGNCYSNKCYCHIGYEGADCSLTMSSSSLPVENNDTNAPVDQPQDSDSSGNQGSDTIETLVSKEFTCFDGYLTNCTVYVDENGNKKFDNNEAANFTNSKGIVAIISNFQGNDLKVIIQNDNECIDTFTNLSISFQYYALEDSKVISPLTTVATLLIDRYGYSKTSASRRINRFANISEEIDIFGFDAIAAAATSNSNLTVNGFIFSSMLASSVQMLSAFYDTAVTTLDSDEISTHVLTAMVDVMAQQSTFSLSSISDLQVVLANLKENAALVDFAIEGTAEEVMLESIAKSNSLYGDTGLSDTIESMNNIVQISLFSQTQVATQLQNLAQHQNETSYTSMTNFISNIHLNNTSFFPNKDIDSDLFFENVPSEDVLNGSGENTPLSLEEENVLEKESERIVDFVEENHLYFIIGGGVLVLTLLVISCRIFARTSQVVKALDLEE